MNIFFDLDGTLLDISKKYYQAHILSSKQVDMMPLSFHRYWLSKRKKIPENQILGLSSKSKIFEIYEQTRISLLEQKFVLDKDSLFPGIINLLKKLKKNHKFYLVTARRNKKNLFDQLKKLRIINYFERVLVSSPENDPVNSKIKLIKRIKYMVDDIIIGDTEADILAGKELGLKQIAVFCGIRNKRLFKKYHPDFLVNNVQNYFANKLQ